VILKAVADGGNDWLHDILLSGIVWQGQKHGFYSKQDVMNTTAMSIKGHPRDVMWKVRA